MRPNKLPIRRKSNFSDIRWKHALRLHGHLLWPASWDFSTLIHPLRTSSSSTANFDRLRRFSPTLRRALAPSLCMLAGVCVCVIIFDSCFLVPWRENVWGWVVFDGKRRRGRWSGVVGQEKRCRDDDDWLFFGGPWKIAKIPCSRAVHSPLFVLPGFRRRFASILVGQRTTQVCVGARYCRCHKWRVSKQNESDRKWRSSVCLDVIIASKRRMKFWSIYRHLGRESFAEKSEKFTSDDIRKV